MNEEQWRPVVGYEGLYEVSNQGRVRSLDRIVHQSGYQRFLKGKVLSLRTSNEYCSVFLCDKNGKISKLVHRLVAKAFIPNPDNKPCIDHINGVRNDNRVENLRWCTHKENTTFPIAIKNNRLGQKNRKIVGCYDLDGNLVKTYDSMAQCKEDGFNFAAVWKCCRGGYFEKRYNKWINKPQYKGYIWKIIEE